MALHTVITKEQAEAIELMEQEILKIRESYSKLPPAVVEKIVAKKRDEKGFNRLFCDVCQTETIHYKPSDNNPAHCTVIHPGSVTEKTFQKQEEENVTCELCAATFARKFARKFFKFDTLCVDCFASETASNVRSGEENISREELENRIANDKTSGLSAAEEFFIAEKTALDALEGTTEQKYLAVKARIEGWSSVIFEANKKKETDYTRLMELRGQLTIAEKEKLKIQHNEYNPGSVNVANVKPIVRKEKMSKDDSTMLKMAQVIFGKKLALCNVVQSQLFKEHPEYYSNGVVVAQYKDEVEKYILDHGAMTDEMAIAEMKRSVMGAKAATREKIVAGTVGVDGRVK